MTNSGVFLLRFTMNSKHYAQDDRRTDLFPHYMNCIPVNIDFSILSSLERLPAAWAAHTFRRSLGLGQWTTLQIGPSGGLPNWSVCPSERRAWRRKRPHQAFHLQQQSMCIMAAPPKTTCGDRTAARKCGRHTLNKSLSVNSCLC